MCIVLYIADTLYIYNFQPICIHAYNGFPLLVPFPETRPLTVCMCVCRKYDASATAPVLVGIVRYSFFFFHYVVYYM